MARTLPERFADERGFALVIVMWLFTVLFVLDEDRPVGALHLHDCLKAGIA